jgi:branched-subunit amino acid ABC-type transport system permease component
VDLEFLAFLVVDGALTGAIYALLALAFVVYKASRMINDSLPGTIIGAFLVGILESLTAGYVDPLVGGGGSHVASYLVLLAVLFVRPYGLFGRPAVERV